MRRGLPLNSHDSMASTPDENKFFSRGFLPLHIPRKDGERVEIVMIEPVLTRPTPPSSLWREAAHHLELKSQINRF